MVLFFGLVFFSCHPSPPLEIFLPTSFTVIITILGDKVFVRVGNNQLPPPLLWAWCQRSFGT